MPATTVDSAQIRDGTVSRSDLNITDVGQSVVAKLIQGTNVSLSSTGADAGTGDVTISVPTLGVSTDAGNAAVLGSDSKIYVGDSGVAKVISQRTRGYSSIGNSAFEVDQRNAGVAVGWSIPFACDRWQLGKVGTMSGTAQQVIAASPVLIPGTNFQISRCYLRLTLQTVQASLGASDYLYILQQIEGPNFRELQTDVHSVSLLVRTSVAGLKFGLTLRDAPNATISLSKLCTIPSAATWTLIPLANLPVFPSANFSITPGTVGYQFIICLAAGSSVTNSSNDVWNSGVVSGAIGQSNFANNAVNSYFDVAFVQHEPGPLCTQLIDKPFSQAYSEALRYFQKSYNFGTAIGTVTLLGQRVYPVVPAGTLAINASPFPCPMAKAPTVTFYNASTGAVNSARDNASVDHGSVVPTNTGDAGFPSISFATATTAAGYLMAHHTADTSW